MSEMQYLKTAFICAFSLSIVILGADSIVKSTKATGKEKVTKDQILKILRGRLSLDQGKFTRNQLEKSQQDRQLVAEEKL